MWGGDKRREITKIVNVDKKREKRAEFLAKLNENISFSRACRSDIFSVVKTSPSGFFSIFSLYGKKTFFPLDFHIIFMRSINERGR